MISVMICECSDDVVCYEEGGERGVGEVAAEHGSDVLSKDIDDEVLNKSLLYGWLTKKDDMMKCGCVVFCHTG